MVKSLRRFFEQTLPGCTYYTYPFGKRQEVRDESKIFWKLPQISGGIQGDFPGKCRDSGAVLDNFRRLWYAGGGHEKLRREMRIYRGVCRAL